MTSIHKYAFGLALCATAACGPSTHDGRTLSQTAALQIAAAGSVPTGLPPHMMVGLFENPGGTWLKNSGVPWDVRYAYFTYGWANNWGYGAHDGSWGGNYMSESSSQGFVPGVEYYCMNGEAGGGEDQFLAKVQNPTTMAEYFGDFKILMQQIKALGTPVVVLLEADGFGFLERQSGGQSNAPAAVASTGMPELASLPNTVAAWGLAFLQLRQSVGATNALLGIHISDWASGNDIGYVQTSIPLQPEVDTVYDFLSPFGLTPNVTGSTFDFLVGDPLDRDSDYYLLVEGQNRWWDASDTASVSSESFNRYAAWLALWNAESGKRWILWQIPLGNSNQLDVCNNGGPSQGYKDNRPEYFFGPSSAEHLTNWAQSGVIGLLFGAGASCQSSYGNDIYTDGQSFIQSRVASFYAAGGLPLSGAAAAPAPASAPAPAGNPPSDPSQYGFEGDADGRTTSSGTASSSTAEAFAGAASLAVALTASAATTQVASVSAPTTPAGATVTFHVWIPAGANVSSVQPFALQGAAGNWSWTGDWQPISALTTNAWNTFTITVPADAATPLAQLGVQFSTSGAAAATAYVDAVSW